MKPLKILFVCEYYPPHIGGVEVFFYELRKALIARGHHVDVVTTSQPDAPASETDKGGTVYRIKVPHMMDRYFFTLLAFPKVMSLASKADIIHCTTYNSIPSAWFASKIRHKKSVLSVHEVLGRDFHARMTGAPLKAELMRFFEQCLLSFHFTHTVAVSKWTQSTLPGFHKKRSSVIYHGIDDMFSNAGDFHKKVGHDEKTFLFFGRTAAQKGFWFLLDSLPKLYASEKMRAKLKFRLMLSGTHAEIDKVRAFLDKNMLCDFVEVRPSVPRAILPDTLKEADAIIVPSFSEGFGFAAAESCACGVPVISSDAGSLPEVVSGKHLFFKTGDEKDLLRNLRLAFDGKWDFSEPKKFTWEKACGEFEELYIKLLG